MSPGQLLEQLALLAELRLHGAEGQSGQLPQGAYSQQLQAAHHFPTQRQQVHRKRSQEGPFPTGCDEQGTVGFHRNSGHVGGEFPFIQPDRWSQMNLLAYRLANRLSHFNHFPTLLVRQVQVDGGRRIGTGRFDPGRQAL